MNNFNTMRFIRALSAIGTRQLDGETAALRLITDELRINNVDFCLQKFSTFAPLVSDSSLIADGQLIESMSTSFIGGKIDANNIISSATSSQNFINISNINFSPFGDAISRNNFYFAPSLAISRKDVDKILRAKSVSASVEVKKVKHISHNVIVGNMIEPKNILFAHYDSIGPGAIDNTSGTALLMKMIIDYRSVARNNLFIIAGNEELSYDFPVYWGHGYRMFEKKYNQIFNIAKKIFVIDCIGHTKTFFSSSMEIIKLGFPIKNIIGLHSKISMVCGDIERLMPVYHSEIDTPENIKEEFMSSALNSLLERL